MRATGLACFTLASTLAAGTWLLYHAATRWRVGWCPLSDFQCWQAQAFWDGPGPIYLLTGAAMLGVLGFVATLHK